VVTSRAQLGTAGHSSSRARGFTLVEIIVVITVLLLATGVIVPSFFRFQHASNYQWTVRRAIGLLGEARGLAISTEHEVAVIFDEQARALRLVVEPAPSDQEVDPDGTAPPVDERAARDLRVLSLPPGTTAAIEADEALLRFYPDGRASSGVLRIERIEMETAVLLTLNPRTGKVRVEEAR
jgi:prepilin-type N-terminal cleavage/methylation domain-containing protein